jgi:hypothetical protein
MTTSRPWLPSAAVVGGGLPIGSAKDTPAMEDLVQDRWVARWHPQASDPGASHVLACAVPPAEHAFAERQKRGAFRGGQARMTPDAHDVIT